MEITLSLKDLGFILIVTCVIILLIYCIGLIKNLIVTVKHTNRILEDTEEMTAIAASRAREVDSVVGDVSEVVGNITDVLKGNQSVISALTNLINAMGSLKNLIKKTEK